MVDNILERLFAQNQNVVVVCRNKTAEETLVDICNSAKKNTKRICIITVNNPYSYLVKKFKENKVDSSKFYFIDCVSTSFMKQVASKQCTYITSPKALTELAIAVNNLPKDIDLVILDSFSGLAVYNSDILTLRFMNSITSRFRRTSIKSIYMAVGNIKPEMLADITLFADKVVNV